MRTGRCVGALLFLVLHLQYGLTLNCPVSLQCECGDLPHVDITCDVSKHGPPTFSNRSLGIQRSVTVLGTHTLSNFFFRNLRVQAVRLHGLNLTSTGCSLLSGLQSTLLELDLSDNALQIVPACTLTGLTKLTSLNLSENRIVTLAQNDFQEVPSLTRLDLSGNSLCQLDGLPFARLENLVFLSLSKNLLTIESETSVPIVLKTLETLDLSRNRLTHFGNKIFIMPSLKYLYLGDNLLSIFALRNVRNVRVLSLRKNRLESLYEHVLREYTGLEDFDLSENLLDSLPPYILALPYLKRLSMAKNQLTSLDLKGIPERQRFSLLNFSDNLVTFVNSGTIPAFREFTLDMSGNKITNWPSIAISYGGNGTTQITINLSRNLLQRAPYFMYLRMSGERNIVHIDLSNNKITSFESTLLFTTIPTRRPTSVFYNMRNNLLETFPSCYIDFLVTFKVLDLSFNRLQGLPPVSCIGYGVRELLLDYNNFTRLKWTDLVKGNYHGTKLEKISFVGNQIAVIDLASAALLPRSLREIDFSQNQLKTLPASVFAMPFLQVLRLKGNPLDCDCARFLGLRTSFCRTVLDESRCSTPVQDRGYLLKCRWRSCSSNCHLSECSLDHFVEVRVNISHFELGFTLTWELYGPGKWSKVRVNVTGVGRDTPTSIHLLNPEDRSYSFVYPNQSLSHDICLEALNDHSQSLGRRCFYDYAPDVTPDGGKTPGFSMTTWDTATLNISPASSHRVSRWDTSSQSPPVHTPVDHLKTGLIIISIICFISVVVVIVVCYRRCKSKVNAPSSRLGQRREFHDVRTLRSFLERTFPCFSRNKDNAPGRESVVLSDLLLNDPEQYQVSRGQTYQDGIHFAQPLLPVRESAGDEVDITEGAVVQGAEGYLFSPSVTSSKATPSTKDKKYDSKGTGTGEGPNDQRPCKNLYETNFSLQVRLDDKCSSDDSDIDHIYEDTLPIENHVKSKQDHLQGTGSTHDVESKNCSELSSSAKPSALVMPVVKNVPTCDSVLSYYECPRSSRVVKQLNKNDPTPDTHAGEPVTYKADGVEEDDLSPPSPPPKTKKIVIVDNPTYDMEPVVLTKGSTHRDMTDSEQSADEIEV
ncbi:uncharacterized protein LOC135467073 [Liolophura sinensis]|uniref:uncharacterized protein LOC135467073 n=1 Tax=Liolophura sinensis TaxID=3198878 RepID=UPI0031583D8B